MLCEYANIFGKPHEGPHSFRIFNLAIVDILATIIAAFLLYHYCKTNFLKTLVILFLLSIIFHRLFCVRTTVDKLLFNK